MSRGTPEKIFSSKNSEISLLKVSKRTPGQPINSERFFSGKKRVFFDIFPNPLYSEPIESGKHRRSPEAPQDFPRRNLRKTCTEPKGSAEPRLRTTALQSLMLSQRPSVADCRNRATRVSTFEVRLSQLIFSFTHRRDFEIHILTHALSNIHTLHTIHLCEPLLRARDAFSIHLTIDMTHTSEIPNYSNLTLPSDNHSPYKPNKPLLITHSKTFSRLAGR